MGFGVRQHARAESISKRAPSTTRTSLRFRIKNLGAVWNRLSHLEVAVISDPAIDDFGDLDLALPELEPSRRLLATISQHVH